MYQSAETPIIRKLSKHCNVKLHMKVISVLPDTQITNSEPALLPESVSEIAEKMCYQCNKNNFEFEKLVDLIFQIQIDVNLDLFPILQQVEKVPGELLIIGNGLRSDIIDYE